MMDKELKSGYFRVVGRCEALEHAAKATCAMPSDKATARLLRAASALIAQAKESALDYAETEINALEEIERQRELNKDGGI
jgi:hypothetical protein